MLSFNERLDLVLSFTRLAFKRAEIRLGGSGTDVDDTGAAEKVWTGWSEGLLLKHPAHAVLLMLEKVVVIPKAYLKALERRSQQSRWMH